MSWSPQKAGRDVGELCGIEPLNVTASNDIDALLALKPSLGRSHAKLLAERGATVVVNDLGVGPDGRNFLRANAEEVADEISDADIRNVIDVHLMGTVWMCRAAWPHMRDAGTEQAGRAGDGVRLAQRVVRGQLEHPDLAGSTVDLHHGSRRQCLGGPLDVDDARKSEFAGHYRGV